MWATSGEFFKNCRLLILTLLWIATTLSRLSPVGSGMRWNATVSYSSYIEQTHKKQTNMLEYVIISQKISHDAISAISIEYHLLSYFDKRSEKSLRRLPTCIALLNIWIISTFSTSSLSKHAKLKSRKNELLNLRENLFWASTQTARVWTTLDYRSGFLDTQTPCLVLAHRLLLNSYSEVTESCDVIG